jgi:hypothetical protein
MALLKKYPAFSRAWVFRQALSVQGSGTDLAAGILPVKLEDNSLGLGRIKLAQDHVELLFHSVVLLLRLRRADVE